jgi:hypothetical protein
MGCDEVAFRFEERKIHVTKMSWGSVVLRNQEISLMLLRFHQPLALPQFGVSQSAFPQLSDPGYVLRFWSKIMDQNTSKKIK